MTSKIIVAIVAIAAAVLSLAAPVAVEAQPVEPVVFACSEAADTAVWRFYTPTSIPPIVHDFDARSNLPTDRVSLYVEQYAGDWNTRLSIPADSLDPYATGSTRLQAGQWTDVGVWCEGEGDVTLTVTRRRDVTLRSVEDPTQSYTESGTFTVPCSGEDEEFARTNRFFHIDPHEHLYLTAYTTDPDTYISMSATRKSDREGYWVFIARTEAGAGAGRGPHHARGDATFFSEALRAAAPIGRVSVWCRGGTTTATARVARREPVSLRRR